MMEVAISTNLDPAMELPLFAGNGSSIDLPFLGCGLRQNVQVCPSSSVVVVVVRRRLSLSSVVRRFVVARPSPSAVVRRPSSSVVVVVGVVVRRAPVVRGGFWGRLHRGRLWMTVIP